MLQGNLRRISASALFIACALAAGVQPALAYGTSPGQGRLLAANYGSAALPPNLGQLVCPEAPGRDGIPIHFKTEIRDPVLPEDFIVRGENGDVRPVLCATFEPSDDVGDRRSILLVGEFGDADDQPVSVEVVGDIWSLDSTLSYRGAYAAMTPLEAPPALILAEVVPQAEWDLDNPGTPIPWGGGSGCPSEGTQQVLRVVWGGGVRAVGGGEITEAEWSRYVVAVRSKDGRVAFVRPFAVGDLNDGDNNHELCLNVQGEPLAVRVPAGLMQDPNNDVNEATRIRVSRHRKF